MGNFENTLKHIIMKTIETHMKTIEINGDFENTFETHFENTFKHIIWGILKTL